MANLATTGDIKAAVLQHAGELTNGQSPFDRLVLTYINRVYMELLGGGSTFTPEIAEPWAWAKAQTPGVLTLKAAYVTDTVNLTNGSTAGGFATAPGATLGSFKNRLLKVDGEPDYYRIADHAPGASTFLLDAEFIGSSGARSFKAHKLEYDLGSQSNKILRLVEPMRVNKPQIYTADNMGKIYGMSSEKLSEEFPLQILIDGVPSHFAVVGEVDGVLRVQFNSSVAADTRVEFDYVPQPVELSYSSTPVVPREDRMVLVYGATYWLMVDKEDSRSETFFRLTQSKLQAMFLARRKEFSRTNANYARMTPREDLDNERARLWRFSAPRY